MVRMNSFKGKSWWTDHGIFGTDTILYHLMVCLLFVFRALLVSAIIMGIIIVLHSIIFGPL
jgi:hypothetical protein